MFRLDADRPVEFCDGLRRRDFLHAGSLAALGLSLTDWFALKASGAAPQADTNCILLMLIGGPSQLDTFDMKPNAPVEIRGPYKPIKTNVQASKFPRIFLSPPSTPTSFRWCAACITQPRPSTTPAIR
jgi:hypothetical protein